MSNRAKNALYSLVLLVAVTTVWWWRQPPKGGERMFIEGETMATTYHITYFDPRGRNFKQSVDSLLILINKSINTYDPDSEISRFNQGSGSMKFNLPYFLPPLRKSAQVHGESRGAFDPTVMPLVNFWGFGPAKALDENGELKAPDSTKVDSLLSMVGFGKIRFNTDSVWKTDVRTSLDFGGIGQGYGADAVTDFLKSKGIVNMFVELGGEGMACGVNLQTQKPWHIGILDPRSTELNQFFKAYISLSDRSFTTSGNYFNYREINGRRYSHTISPVTGYPAQQALLSASVFAADCATADSWGTAFMVMGHENAIQLLSAHPELDALLIYSTPEGIATFATQGISAQLEIQP